MQKTLIFFIFCLSFLQLSAQPEYEYPQNYRIKYGFQNPINNLTFSSSNINAPSSRDITLRKVALEKIYPRGLENLIEKHQSFNEKYKEQDGFRIQIVSTMDQNVVKKVRMEFSELNTNMKIYQVYDRPYYKVRVGDFATKFEAEQMVYVLLKTFPAAFVVPDKVRLN